MRSTLILLATAAMAATPALATSGQHYCNQHHKYDNCGDKPTPKPTPNPTPKPTPTPTPAPTQNQTANGGHATSTSGANAGAVAGATSGSKSNATGGQATGGNGYATGGAGGAGGSSKSDATGITGGSFGGAASNTNKIGVDSSVYGGDQNSSLSGTNTATLTGGAQSNRGGDQSLTGGAQTLTGGDVRNDNSSGVSTSGNSNVDASDRSVTNYTSKTLFIPPVVPPTPPSQVAIGNIIKETLACGPLQMVVKTPVIGVSRGLLTKSKVDQGVTYDLAAYTDAQGNIVDYRKVDFPDGSGYKLFGSQVVIFSTIIGVSSGGNFAIGGGGGNQSWGQAGGGTSSSMTRLVTNIQIAQCEVGSVKYVPVEREIPVAPKKKGQ